MKSFRLSRILPWVMMLAGIAVVAYLVGASLVNDLRTQQTVERIQQASAKIPSHRADDMIKAAKRYNTKPLNGPLVDPWLDAYVPSGKEYRAYLKRLDYGDGTMGQIVIPKIHVKLPIYHGTQDRTLQRGVGHLFGTSLPVGGKSTHAVLTAHSGLATKTLFDHLPDLRKGDTFLIQVGQKKLQYRVYATQVVEPSETEPLRVRAGKDLVTLITCTPYGINTHRLFVHAHRVPLDPKQAAELDRGPSLHWEPWMTFAVIATAAALLLFLWILRRKPKRDPEPAARPACGSVAETTPGDEGSELTDTPRD